MNNMDSTILIIILLFGILGCINAEDYYVIAPNSLRLNSNETIGVAMDGSHGEVVRIEIEDYPGKAKKIVQKEVTVNPGKPELLKVFLDPEDFPPDFLSTPNSPKLVSLSAHFPNFLKEILIPIHTESGYVFIQTDKPIYSPEDRVSIRVISLNEDLVPSHGTLLLQIKNPNDSIVKEKIFSADRRDLSEAFEHYFFRFPTYPVLGEWSTVVKYGYNLEQNSAVHFHLQEYVVPTFAVEVETPNVILPFDETIKIKVTAEYFYGRRKVIGLVSFRLGVKKVTGETIFFAIFSPRQLENGSYNLEFKTEIIKYHRDVHWFPEIENSRLYAEVTVVEAATGKEEDVVDTKSYFTMFPFVISFKRCLRYFRPGLTSVIEADIFYANGQPADGIWIKINASADNTKQMNIVNDFAKSDEDGKIVFQIQPEVSYRTIDIKLETHDPKYVLYPVKRTFQQRASLSKNNAYIALARNRPKRLKPMDSFERSIHFQPAGIQNIYFLVMARGRILIWENLLGVQHLNYSLKFRITYEMAPSFRVLIFAQHEGQLLADSLKIDVEHICNPDAEVFIEPEYSGTPGHNWKINFRATERTSIGLFFVDEAIYVLSKQDPLTKEKIFNRLESHDMGCGPGGGSTVDSVLGNAGIIIGATAFSPSHSYSCVEIRRRRKRQADIDFDTEVTGIVKRKRDVEPILIDVEVLDMFESKTLLRKDFKQSWIFIDFEIGMNRKEEIVATWAHSITAWVMQAISVSPKYGICVAEPQKLESFMTLFLQLNLPYSVIRNEQVEIQVTVFNYHERKQHAIVYMYGAKDLCSGAGPGKRSESKEIIIDRKSAETVSFPVIPLKAGVILIKVLLITSNGTDKVERELHVVHEGITKEKNIFIRLDPTNLQKRRGNFSTSSIIDMIYPSQNLQVTTVKLDKPEGYVPGSASCFIRAVGYLYRFAVETTIDNAENLIHYPSGSGESNMIRFAPILYTVRYLKATGKLTAEAQEKGYQFIREGYANQLNYRKEDGSYAAFKDRPATAWLTAFVMKVFCQANDLIHIDENVVCSGIRWLIHNQQLDG